MKSGAMVAREPSTVRSRWGAWFAYAACAWAFAFAAMSFYWAAGGTAGADTLGPAVTDPALARDPGFVALLWGTGALKLAGGLMALALVQRWGRIMPRWLLLTATWGGGLFMLVYAGLNLGVRGLMAVGVLRTPDSMRTAAAQWHLLLWDPWWLLGGILFVAASWLASAHPAAHRKSVSRAENR